MAKNPADGRPVEGDKPNEFARALPTTRRTPLGLGLVLGGLVAVAVVLLIVQNGESAQLDWLTFHFSAPLWIMLALTLVAGAVVWELVKVSWHRSRRLRSERRAAMKAAKDLRSAR